VPSLAPEATCAPSPGYLLVPPVGTAWIGSLQGTFDYGDGKGPTAVWAVDEILVGDLPADTDTLTYAQPACDAILEGGFGDRFLVSTADPAAPTVDDTVIWSINAHDTVSLIHDTGSPAYDVRTLDEARALVLSGDMPAGSAPSPSASVDPAAQPRALLEAYLQALRSGDCAAGRTLTLPSFRVGSGELCGALTVMSVTLDPLEPARPNDHEAVYSTTLTVTGGDQSMPDGTYTWFYDLLEQPDGTWLIAGGGSGP